MRNIAVSFTFTDEDFNRIKVQAEREGMSMRCMVRRLVQDALTVREHALAYHEAEADKADGWRP